MQMKRHCLQGRPVAAIPKLEFQCHSGYWPAKTKIIEITCTGESSTLSLDSVQKVTMKWC